MWFDRIRTHCASPSFCCLSPTSRTRYYFCSSGYPLRLEAGPLQSLIRLSTAVQERSRAGSISVPIFRLLVHGHALEPGLEYLRVRNVLSLARLGELQEVAIEDG